MGDGTLSNLRKSSHLSYFFLFQVQFAKLAPILIYFFEHEKNNSICIVEVLLMTLIRVILCFCAN